MLPQIENTKGVNVQWSTLTTRWLYDLFFSGSFIAWNSCRDLFRYLQVFIQVFRSNTLRSKNACRPLSQNPLALMSSLSLFDRFVVLLWSFSPDRGNNFDSIFVSLQPSDTIFAVRARKLLCLMLTKPPFSQLMLCWILNLLYHKQNVGKLVISQPYHKLSESKTSTLIVQSHTQWLLTLWASLIYLLPFYISVCLVSAMVIPLSTKVQILKQSTNCSKRSCKNIETKILVAPLVSIFTFSLCDFIRSSLHVKAFPK